MVSRLLLPALLLAVVPLTALAAEADIQAVDSIPTDTTLVIDSVIPEPPVDTLIFERPGEVAAAARVTNAVNLEEHLTQTPTLALFKSMLVPGLGQLGNRSYFKATLFAGLEAWFIASAVHYGRQANDAEILFAEATNENIRREWHSFLENKRINRNKFAWFAGLTIFISMFDAYVDAHLSGSPVDPRNEKFAVEVVPDKRTGARLQLSCRF